MVALGWRSPPRSGWTATMSSCAGDNERPPPENATPSRSGNVPPNQSSMTRPSERNGMAPPSSLLAAEPLKNILDGFNPEESRHEARPTGHDSCSCVCIHETRERSSSHSNVWMPWGTSLDVTGGEYRTGLTD